MDKVAVTGALAKCTMGLAPAPLTFLPMPPLLTPTPAGTIMGMVPFLNVMPFGMCKSPSNPQVAAATAAALGVLTPQPCIPLPVGPWTNPSKMMLGVAPAITGSSKLSCAWAGKISMTFPGQVNMIAG